MFYLPFLPWKDRRQSQGSKTSFPTLTPPPPDTKLSPLVLSYSWNVYSVLCLVPEEYPRHTRTPNYYNYYYFVKLSERHTSRCTTRKVNVTGKLRVTKSHSIRDVNRVLPRRPGLVGTYWSPNHTSLLSRVQSWSRSRQYSFY